MNKYLSGIKNTRLMLCGHDMMVNLILNIQTLYINIYFRNNQIYLNTFFNHYYPITQCAFVKGEAHRRSSACCFF